MLVVGPVFVTGDEPDIRRDIYHISEEIYMNREKSYKGLFSSM